MSMLNCFGRLDISPDAKEAISLKYINYETTRVMIRTTP